MGLVQVTIRFPRFGVAAATVAVVVAGAVPAGSAGSASRAASEVSVVRVSDFRIPLATVGGSVFAAGRGSVSNTLYRSTDDGESWTVMATLPGRVLELNESPSGTLLAGVNDGYYTFYRSTDGGSSWVGTTQQYPSAPGQQVHGFRAPGNVGYYLLLGHDSVVSVAGVTYAVTYTTNASITNPNFVYRTLDDGRTWQIVSSSTEFRHTHAAVAAAGGFFALFGDSSGDGIRFTALDAGVSWEPTCTAYACVAAEATLTGSGALAWGSDNPELRGGPGDNAIWRMASPREPGSTVQRVRDVTHVSYGARTGPDGAVWIGRRTSRSRRGTTLRCICSCLRTMGCRSRTCCSARSLRQRGTGICE